MADTARADVSLPAIFGDHMVVQANQPLPVWGTATAGRIITVTLAGQSKNTAAAADGSWRLTLDPVTASGPLTLTVSGDGDPVILTDVLAGEVWIASGQSNMELPLADTKTGRTDAAAADLPQIRTFRVAHNPSDRPTDEFQGHWQVCTPRSAPVQSAVAFYFARELNHELGRPVGVIESHWNGTTAEAWTPRPALESSDLLRPILDRYTAALDKRSALMPAYEKSVTVWRTKVATHDPGITSASAAWAGASFDDSAWESFTPGMMTERTRSIDGAFWFRRTVTLPAAWAGRPLTLTLGSIANADQTFFSSQPIGATENGTLAEDTVIRRVYTVPAGIVKAGPATIAVRVFNAYRTGAFDCGDESMALRPADAKPRDAIDLRDGWRTAVEWSTRQPASTPAEPPPPLGPGTARTPSNLYNGMIYPVIPYGIRGVIWYQGESNVARAEQYRTLLPALIRGWREAWNQSANRDFPFYVVQLPAYHAPATRPVEPSEWAELREAQALGTAAAGHSDVAVTIDTGESKNIHPVAKEPVGRRLAALALHDVYGRQNPAARGPRFHDFRIDGGRVTVRFDDTGNGLTTQDGRPPSGFAVAGEDRVWKAADALIVDDAVVVRSDEIAHPVAVRYAWADHPAVNLANRDGLPVAPFRTDGWAETTSGKR